MKEPVAGPDGGENGVACFCVHGGWGYQLFARLYMLVACSFTRDAYLTFVSWRDESYREGSGLTGLARPISSNCRAASVANSPVYTWAVELKSFDSAFHGSGEYSLTIHSDRGTCRERGCHQVRVQRRTVEAGGE